MKMNMKTPVVDYRKLRFNNVSLESYRHLKLLLSGFCSCLSSGFIMLNTIVRFATNTNVCPSLHVIGSVAVMETALWSERIKSKDIKTGLNVIAILICASTEFLKQHSVLDLLAAYMVIARF